MNDAAPPEMPRTRPDDLRALTEAQATWCGAFAAVPPAALHFLPDGEDYALGGLADHVAGVAANYAILLRALAASSGAMAAPADPPEEPDVAARIHAGLEPAERPEAEARVAAAHAALAEAAAVIPADAWAVLRDVTFPGSAMPFPTSPALVIEWVRDHDLAHARQVAELLARREDVGADNGADHGADHGAAIDLANRFTAAWNARDLEGALALCADDLVFDNTWPAPDGALVTGKPGVAAAWRDVFANPVLRLETEEVFAAGSHVVVRWRYSWGDGHVRGVDLLEIRDGLIAAKRSYVKG